MIRSCVEWRSGFEYKSEVDQFNIFFKDKREKLIQFLDAYAVKQRVNICIPSDISVTELDIIIALYETKKYNISIRLNWFTVEENEYVYNKLKEKKIPFYFMYLIDNWDELLGYCSLGVSEVYITGELGFDLVRVSKVVREERGIKVRCYSDICQEGWERKDGITAFFIRPDDMELLSNYIDTVEFYDSVDRQNTVYKIYFIDKKWYGNLQEVIKGLSKPIYDRFLLQGFTERRINCRKKCIKGDFCTNCETLINLADTMYNNKHFNFEKALLENEQEVPDGEGSISEAEDSREDS